MSCRVRLLWLVGAGLAFAALSGCDGLTYRAPPPPPPLEERQRRAAESARAMEASAVAAAEKPPRRKTPSPARSALAGTRPVIQPYTEWSTAEAAADALGRIGPAAVPQLSTLLHDEDPEVRQQAARILARIGPNAVAAVPDLIQLLQDQHPQVQLAAARALGQIGPEAAAAVPALLRMMDRPAAGATVEDAPPRP